MPPQTRTRPLSSRARHPQEGRLQLQLPKQPQELWESRLIVGLPPGLSSAAVHSAAFKLDSAIQQLSGVRWGSVRVHQQRQQQGTNNSSTKLAVGFAAPPDRFVQHFYGACNGQLCLSIGSGLQAGLVPAQGHTPVHIQVPLGTTPDNLAAAFAAASSTSGISMVAGSARYVSSISGRVAHDTIFAVLTAKQGSIVPKELSFVEPVATRIGSVQVLALAAPCMAKRHVHAGGGAQQQQQPRQRDTAATFADKVRGTTWHANPAAGSSSSSSNSSSSGGDEVGSAAPETHGAATERGSTPVMAAAQTGGVGDNSSTAEHITNQQGLEGANTAAMQDGAGGGQQAEADGALQPAATPCGTKEVPHTIEQDGDAGGSSTEPNSTGAAAEQAGPGDGFQPSAAQLAAERRRAKESLGGEGRAACRAGQLASPAPVGNDGFRPDSVRYNSYSPYGRPGGGYGGYGGYGGSPYGTPSGGGYGGPSYGPVPYGPVGQAEGGTAGTPGGVVGGTRPRPPKAADTTPWTPAAKRQQ